MNQYHEDKPISSSDEDQFERASFASRIARLSVNNMTGQSLVIGVYGKWGEGKTSLLNLVEDSLPIDTVKVKFNPWLFTEEETIIRAFFDSVATALGKSVKGNKERIGETLKTYGAALGSFISVGSEGAKIAGEKLSVITIEEAKRRVDDFIVESEQDLVIFIDDIDRLTATEVQIIFKLVKLGASFPRTTYLLAFDDEMVARMLSPQFGGPSPQAGYQYLEKIIQLPLHLPKPSKAALRATILKFIGNSLQSEKIVFEEESITNTVELLLPVITNPRVAARLTNAVRFAVPLLDGEANIHNIILVEGLRVTFPKMYDFIRHNRRLMLYEDGTIYTDGLKKETVIEAIQNSIDQHSEKVRPFLIKIIHELFPNICRLMGSGYSYRSIYDNPHQQQLIWSPQYFDRYFNYAVQKGELSDTYFKSLFSQVELIDLDDLATRYKTAFHSYSAQDILYKLNQHKDLLEGENGEKIVLALSLIAEIFGYSKGFDLASILRQVLNIIQRKVEQSEDKLDFAETIVRRAPLVFTSEFLGRVVIPKDENDKNIIFNVESEAYSLKTIFVERYKQAVGESDLFTPILDDWMIRPLMWWAQVDKDGLKDAVATWLSNGDNNALRLLKAYAPTTYSTDGYGNTELFKTRKIYYDLIESAGIAEQLYNVLEIEYGDQKHLATDNFGDRDAVNDLTLIGFFQKLYTSYRSSLEEL